MIEQEDIDIIPFKISSNGIKGMFGADLGKFKDQNLNAILFDPEYNSAARKPLHKVLLKIRQNFFTDSNKVDSNDITGISKIIAAILSDEQCNNVLWTDISTALRKKINDNRSHGK